MRRFRLRHIAIAAVIVFAACDDGAQSTALTPPPGVQTTEDMIEAAARGNVRAQNILGAMYLEGRDDLAQNAVKAYQYSNLVVKAWIASGRSAYEFDAAIALNRLGEMTSLIRDYAPDSGSRAHAYFAVAARLGHKDAAKQRDKLAETLTAQEITQAQRWADELYGRK